MLTVSDFVHIYQTKLLELQKKKNVLCCCSECKNLYPDKKKEIEELENAIHEVGSKLATPFLQELAEKLMFGK